jgi:hypothetical protein
MEGRAFCWVPHRTTTVACPVPISFLFRHTRPLQLQVCWRTGHCPVYTRQSGARSRPLELPRVTRGLRGRSLVLATVGSPDNPVRHRTVRWIIATSPFPFPESDKFSADDSPDSPVNYSCTPPLSPESSLFTRTSLAHRTVRCARPSWTSAAHSQVFCNSFLFFFSLSLTLRQIY